MCGTCALGYVKSPLGGCILCPGVEPGARDGGDGQSVLVVLIAGGIVTTFFAAAIFFLLRRTTANLESSSHTLKGEQQLSSDWGRAKKILRLVQKEILVSEKGKLTVAFFQIASMFNTYGVLWPTSVRRALDLSQVAQFDLVSATGIDCVVRTRYYDVFLATLFVPIVLFAVLWAVNRLVIFITVRRYIRKLPDPLHPPMSCMHSSPKSAKSWRKASKMLITTSSHRVDDSNAGKDQYVSATMNRLIWDEISVMKTIPSAVPPHLKRTCACYPQGDEAVDKRKMCKRGRLQWRLTALRNRVVKVTLLVLFGLFVPLTRQIMRLWQCVEVGHTWYLVADLNVECYDETWWSFATGSLVVGGLIIFGVPAVFLLLVFTEKNRNVADYLSIIRPALGTLRFSPTLLAVSVSGCLRRWGRCCRKLPKVAIVHWSDEQLAVEMDLMLQRARSDALARQKGWRHPVGGTEKAERIVRYLGSANLSNPRVVEHIGFMYLSYRRDAYVYEFVEFMRKTFLVAFAVFVADTRSNVVYTTAFAFLTFTINVAMQPYAEATNGLYSAMLLFMVLVLGFCGLIVFEYQERQAYSSYIEADADEFIGQIGMGIIIAMIIVLLTLLVHVSLVVRSKYIEHRRRMRAHRLLRLLRKGLIQTVAFSSLLGGNRTASGAALAGKLAVQSKEAAATAAKARRGVRRRGRGRFRGRGRGRGSGVGATSTRGSGRGRRSSGKTRRQSAVEMIGGFFSRTSGTEGDERWTSNLLVPAASTDVAVVGEADAKQHAIANEVKDEPRAALVEESAAASSKGDWEECLDEASGCTYYYNSKTQTSVWEKPEDF